MAAFELQSPAALEREAAARAASRAKRVRRIAALILAALLVTAWAFGYAQGFFDGTAGRGTVFQSKEST